MANSRPTVWQDTIVGVTLVSGAAQTVIGLLPGLTEQDKRQSTITRVLIRLNMYEATLNSGTALQSVKLGMGVASQEAFTTAGAIPDPGVAAERPTKGWYWRDAVIVASSTASTDNVIPVTRLMADIGAMRKLENGEFYLTVTNTGDIGLDFNVVMSGLIRTLVRLP